MALGQSVSVKELMSKFKGHWQSQKLSPINAALENLGNDVATAILVQRPVIHSSSDVYRIFYPCSAIFPTKNYGSHSRTVSSLVIEKVKISQCG